MSFTERVNPQVYEHYDQGNQGVSSKEYAVRAGRVVSAVRKYTQGKEGLPLVPDPDVEAMSQEWPSKKLELSRYCFDALTNKIILGALGKYKPDDVLFLAHIRGEAYSTPDDPYMPETNLGVLYRSPGEPCVALIASYSGPLESTQRLLKNQLRVDLVPYTEQNGEPSQQDDIFFTQRDYGNDYYAVCAVKPLESMDMLRYPQLFPPFIR